MRYKPAAGMRSSFCAALWGAEDGHGLPLTEPKGRFGVFFAVMFPPGCQDQRLRIVLSSTASGRLNNTCSKVATIPA